jgi:hypothetical protein
VYNFYGSGIKYLRNFIHCTQILSPFTRTYILIYVLAFYNIKGIKTSRKGILSQNTLIYVNKGHNKSLRDQYIFITLIFYKEIQLI